MSKARRKNAMPPGYQHISDRTRANMERIAPHIGKLRISTEGSTFVLHSVNDTGVLYWNKPKQKKVFVVLGLRIDDIPRLLQAQG